MSIFLLNLKLQKIVRSEISDADNKFVSSIKGTVSPLRNIENMGKISSIVSVT